MNLKPMLFPFISILFGIFLSILLLEVVFRVLPVRDDLMPLPVNASNPVIRFKADREVIWSRGYNFSIVTRKHINNYGFFNDQDYKPEDKSPLLAVIGDSYVEAAQVSNKKSMHGILSQKIFGKGRVYSFGVSGSPLSNYLAYANYAKNKFHPDAMVFIIIGNDFDESLTRYKNDPGFHYFSNTSEGLDLVRKDYRPTFSKHLFKQSALIRYLYHNLQFNREMIANIFKPDAGDVEEFVGNTRADFDERRLSGSKKAVDRFFEELPLQTGLGKESILFVIDGMRPQLYSPSDLMKASGSYFDLMRQYFMDAALKNNYEVIDMQPLFIKKHESEKMKFEFPSDGHWNEAGHFFVAERIKKSGVYRTLFNK